MREEGEEWKEGEEGEEGGGRRDGKKGEGDGKKVTFGIMGENMY